MILCDFILLATEQPRSRAYIQKMINNDIMPSFVIYLNDNKNNSTYVSSKREKAYFNVNKSLLETIKENNIPYTSLETTDCNSNIVIDEIKKRKEMYVIFSASGILKDDILSLGKKIIHVHPGIIPKYRGNTCFYYSMINDENIGATAFIMNKGIDKGDIISQKIYEVPKNINIDNIYDPYIRAELLYDVIKDYIESGEIKSSVQDVNSGETYYVIHPILKHLAILKNTEKNVGNVYSLIGLSGSGKSTLANMLYRYLKEGNNRPVKIIDGDEVRKAIGGTLGYSIEDRRKSAYIVTYMANMLSQQGIDVIIANIGAFEDIRQYARREIVNYNEIYIKCSLEECSRRDVKGYYKKAFNGEIKDFIGIDQKFEEPLNADLVINTENNDISTCYNILIQYIDKFLYVNKNEVIYGYR